MRIIHLVSIAFLLLASCCTVNVDHTSGIQGVDPAAQPYVNDYKQLAKENGVTFTKEVPVAFGKILRKEVVAECFMGANSREILISTQHWNEATKAARLEIIFHELTHCYCGRFHTYKGVEYASYDSSRVAFYGDGTSAAAQMFYPEDGCPKSMMFPMVLDNECTLAHFNDYQKDLFDGCVAW